MSFKRGWSCYIIKLEGAMMSRTRKPAYLSIWIASVALHALQPVPAVAEQSTQSRLNDLFGKSHVVIREGNWFVTTGETYNHLTYCAMASFTQTDGARVSLRVLSSSPEIAEWRVQPLPPNVRKDATGLNTDEMKQMLVADFAPESVARTGSKVVEGLVSVGDQPPFTIPFKTIKTGSADIQDRYWWITRIEPLDAFERVAGWGRQFPLMKMSFPNTDLPDVSVTMFGFSKALTSLRQCLL